MHQNNDLNRSFTDDSNNRNQRVVWDNCYSEIGGEIRLHWPSRGTIQQGGPTKGNGYFVKDGRIVRHMFVDAKLVLRAETISVIDDVRAFTVQLEDETTPANIQVHQITWGQLRTVLGL